MVVIKRKQIIVLSLVIMILIAGYLQYSYSRSSVASNDGEKGRLGEAVYVDSESLTVKDSIAGIEIEEIPASKEANDFFAHAKLDREITRSRDTDSLRELTENENTSEEVRNEAYMKMIAIIDNTEKEMRIENLIKERGFDDVIVYIADDGSIDVVVKSPSLTQAQVAQITDIVTRQADVGADKIHLKIKY